MGKKILLADDSITIQKVIELTFSDEDFDVITVGNGRLALEKLPEVRPDIVLCDIIMPEKDGYEVCEQIKTNPVYSHIPVLLLTGAFEPFDQERAARAGYDGSLAKPFEPETLIAKVKDLLARAPVRASAPPASIVRPAPMAALLPAVPPPAVLPFQRPAPAAPVPPPFVAPPAAVPSFIPDEPFGGLEDSAFDEPGAPAGPPAHAFAPMTEEESATLLVPPATAPSSADAASTVMFRAGDLPWSAQPVPPPPEPPLVAAPKPVPAVPPLREPEPVIVAEAVDAAEAIEDPAVFEEVLEEDLDFGTHSFEPEPQVENMLDEATGALLMPVDVATLPPMPPEDERGVTGTLAPGPVLAPPAAAPEPVVAAKPTAAFEPEPMAAFEPEPTAAFEPEPTPAFGRRPASAFEPPPVPAFEPEQQGAFVDTLSPVLEPVVAAPPSVPETPPVAPESFADVAVPVAAPAPPPPPPSEAAAFSVPVEMVEKIAQRVVAQISEKAVREIAWEVIPDLAEALIKQEIERLKAELQKI